MRRTFKYLPLLAAVAALAACSDEPTAPGARPRALPPAGPALDIIYHAMADDSTSADFSVTPTGGTFTMGQHSVYFPPSSICEPATSSYGPGTWDEPCEAATRDIQIHAEVRRDSLGQASVHFTPELRFVPTTDPAQYVLLFLRTPEAQDSAAVADSKILWAPEAGAAPVDEALEDPTQKVQVWSDAQILYRRVKHFSGYNVALGLLGVNVEIGLGF